jgi:hypothetical protein
MGLLRNASGLLIPDAFGGKPGRADDPEFHIRRLQHFGQGMGIDLASTHPTFSGKRLYSNVNYPKFANARFDSHDEGLEMSTGHVTAYKESINQDESGHGGRSRIRQAATDELLHRAPYEHSTYIDDGDMRGSIHKNTSKKTPHAGPGSLPDKWISSTWGEGYQGANKTHRDAIKDVSSKFQEFNRNRQGSRSVVSELVNRGVNNPSERLMDELRRRAPNMLGSQFLGLSHIGIGDNERDIIDQIDLKTGTWAKIDPEGYFPD